MTLFFPLPLLSKPSVLFLFPIFDFSSPSAPHFSANWHLHIHRNGPFSSAVVVKLSSQQYVVTQWGLSLLTPGFPFASTSLKTLEYVLCYNLSFRVLSPLF